MPFWKTWSYIQSNLHAGQLINNWTKAGRYKPGTFPIVKVGTTSIKIKAIRTHKPRPVPMGDFEKVYNVWNQYNAGIYSRYEIRNSTRHSTYIISVLHWVEQNNHGMLP